MGRARSLSGGEAVNRKAIPGAIKKGTGEFAQWQLATPNAAVGSSHERTAQAALRSVLSEELFHVTLTLERRRAERCRKPFVLMLLDAHRENGTAPKLLQRALASLNSFVRDIDTLGWYKDKTILGIIFTEVGEHGKDFIANTLRTKVDDRLREQAGELRQQKRS